MKTAFENDLYLKRQSERILKLVNENKHDRLYLEFGGKILDDKHASRVLPGFNPKNKMLLIDKIKEDAEVILCVNANHIERNKMRADNGLTYDQEVMRLIDELKMCDIKINCILITLFNGQPAAEKFGKKLKLLKQNVLFHSPTKGYPNDVNTIVSEEGYGKNPYIKLTKKLIIVTAPGPCSAKLGTCLSQLYHDYKNGVTSTYAKFETFPVWNLPLKHPVNIAYEASTADLGDVNVIDPFYLQATGKIAVNYNRDVESFSVLKNIFEKIIGKMPFNSPTEMGINEVGNCITDDEAVQTAGRIEVYRRLLRSECDFVKGIGNLETLVRTKMLASEVNANIDCYEVEKACIDHAKKANTNVLAIELKDKTIIFGKSKQLLSASAACVLNALKHLAGINDKINLISEEVLKPILDLKQNVFNKKESLVQIEDALIALAVSALTNHTAKLALSKITELNFLNAHSSCILNSVEEISLRNLKIELTCSPRRVGDKLYTN